MEYAKKIKVVSDMGMTAILATAMLRHSPELDLHYVLKRSWQLVTAPHEDLVEWKKAIESKYFPSDPILE